MPLAFTNLDIAASDAFARHEDEATAAGRGVFDQDAFTLGYKARASEMKDGPYHDLTELGHEVRACLEGQGPDVDLVRSVVVPADLLERLGSALAGVAALESDDAEAVDAGSPATLEAALQVAPAGPA